MAPVLTFTTAPSPPRWEVEARVTALICAQAGLPRAAVRPGDRLVEDLGIDSLDLVGLVLALEEEFAVRLDDERQREVLHRPPRRGGGDGARHGRVGPLRLGHGRAATGRAAAPRVVLLPAAGAGRPHRPRRAGSRPLPGNGGRALHPAGRRRRGPAPLRRSRRRSPPRAARAQPGGPPAVAARPRRDARRAGARGRGGQRRRGARGLPHGRGAGLRRRLRALPQRRGGRRRRRGRRGALVRGARAPPRAAFSPGGRPARALATVDRGGGSPADGAGVLVRRGGLRPVGARGRLAPGGQRSLRGRRRVPAQRGRVGARRPRRGHRRAGVPLGRRGSRGCGRRGSRRPRPGAGAGGPAPAGNRLRRRGGAAGRRGPRAPGHVRLWFTPHGRQRVAVVPRLARAGGAPGAGRVLGGTGRPRPVFLPAGAGRQRRGGRCLGFRCAAPAALFLGAAPGEGVSDAATLFRP